MGKIDDPLDQLEFVHRDEPQQGLAQLLNLSAPVVALLNPTIGALVTITGFLKAMSDQKSLEARAEAFRGGVVDEVRQLVGRVEVIEKKTSEPAAQEAFNVAMRAALATARLDKAR